MKTIFIYNSKLGMMRKVIALLRQRGFKITSQRRAVLRVIVDCQEHLTPAEIYERVHKEYPGIGLVTVYRTLDVLTELGLICEVHAEDGRRSYLLTRPLEHHHHLICSDCGRVIDFTGCYLGQLEKRLSQETGFKIVSHLLEFTGCCPNCQKAAST
jgi:Fur family ferric uptake transcriptional regulator